MSQRLTLRAALLLAFLGLGGCVERQYLIDSEPRGAIVLENGKPVGATPLYRPFNYYGTYRFTLIKDGFQTLVVDEHIKAPWYEYPPFDFFTEVLWPFTVRDKRVIQYPMQPQQIVPAEMLLNRSEELRSKAHGMGSDVTGGIGP